MKGRLLLIDTETGGLDASRHSILSLAALVLNYDGQIIDEMYTLINEGELLVTEQSALKVNGLTVERVREEGVTPLYAVGMLFEMLKTHDMIEGVTIVAHNAKFDFEFLKRLFRVAGINESVFNLWFTHRTICTQAGAGLLVQAGVVKADSTSLDSLCAAAKITIDRSNGHNALLDATATAHLFQWLLRRCQEGL
jgi:DNA polymerase-3 subunit epsilon